MFLYYLKRFLVVLSRAVMSWDMFRLESRDYFS